MAALAPMPSARVRTTVAASPLERRSERIANRMSRPSASAASSQRCRHTLRIESRVSVRLPNSFSAARRAARGSSPPSIRSLILRARWPRISASRSSSPGLPRLVPNRIASALAVGRRIHDPPDGVHELRPSVLLACELRLALCRQPVELRTLVGLAHIPFRPEPAALFEAVERRVERAGFDLEEAVRLRTNGLTDAVTVAGTPLQGPEDEHVEGALEELEAFAFGVFGHRGRQSTALDVECLQPVPASARLRSRPSFGAAGSHLRSS